jgi:2-C-methyl-D-erythritol 4-phosphate cytidylyltransferase
MSNFAGRLSDIIRAITGDGVDPHSRFNSAIIVAAGNGERMGKDKKLTKQMTELDGIPVVVRAVNAFERCDFINEIIVVGRADELCYYSDFAKKYGWKNVKHVVPGGETRQKSVFEGFKVIDDRSEFVIIHDGARCLVTPEIIERVTREAYIYGAATAAERAKDTIKKADKSGFIAETVDRALLWHAQTPQIFKTELYRAAAYIAAKNGYEVTDDCMLAENLGFKIKLVDCGYENIKITTPDDFDIAHAILESRARRGIK